MFLDSSTVAIFITVLLAVLGLAAAWGALSQRVSNQDAKIDVNQKSTEKEMERMHSENREDHRQIFSKLEEINAYLRNGKM